MTLGGKNHIESRDFCESWGLCLVEVLVQQIVRG